MSNHYKNNKLYEKDICSIITTQSLRVVEKFCIYIYSISNKQHGQTKIIWKLTHIMIRWTFLEKGLIKSYSVVPVKRSNSTRTT